MTATTGSSPMAIRRSSGTLRVQLLIKVTSMLTTTTALAKVKGIASQRACLFALKANHGPYQSAVTNKNTPATRIRKFICWIW